jgi:hypothetical protein
MKRMSIKKCEDGWWIVDPNNEDCGPYDTKAEATDDKQGLARFYRNYDNKTSEEIYEFDQDYLQVDQDDIQED